MILLINKNLAKILMFLAISPGSSYTRKELKEKTEMNNLPLDNSLSELLVLRIINKKNKLYFLNLENLVTKFILNEIKEKFLNIPLKVQFLILDFIYSILKIKKINKIILFGSYLKLIYSEKSDVDIAVILDSKIGEKSKSKIGRKISLIAEKLSKKHKKEIQEHIFEESDLKHKEDALIKDILRGRNLI